ACSAPASYSALDPHGPNRAAATPRSSPPRASCRRSVGPSPYTSSPTSASAMARRMAGVGRVTVSERRSMGRGAASLMAPDDSASLAGPADQLAGLRGLAGGLVGAGAGAGSPYSR